MNAQLKTSTAIESIYDHGVTASELHALFGEDPDTQGEYLDGLSSDCANGDLFKLYRLRGEASKSRRFLSLISSESWRNTLSIGYCQGH